MPDLWDANNAVVEFRLHINGTQKTVDFHDAYYAEREIGHDIVSSCPC